VIFLRVNQQEKGPWKTSTLEQSIAQKAKFSRDMNPNPNTATPTNGKKPSKHTIHAL
jgi:hypothetical protein